MTISRWCLIYSCLGSAITLRSEEVKAYYSSTDAGELVYYLERERVIALSSHSVETTVDFTVPVTPEAAVREAVSVAAKEHHDWLVTGFYLLTLSDVEIDGHTLLQYSVMLRAKKKDGTESVLTIPVLMDGKSMAFRSEPISKKAKDK